MLYLSISIFFCNFQPYFKKNTFGNLILKYSCFPPHLTETFEIFKQEGSGLQKIFGQIACLSVHNVKSLGHKSPHGGSLTDELA